VSAAPVPALPVRSIAVLPFVDMSQAKDQEYFSDGLSETLLDILAQVPDLKVAARTSSFAFKGKAEDARAIGTALGVANLLEGSVQKSGDTVRITAQLIKASDGTHLWSKHFDRKLDDVFSIQDEIATEVVGALKIVLDRAEAQHLTQKRTDNVGAYQEYLRGIGMLPRRKVAELRDAAAHFERAITLDPAFAKAYVGASDAYRLLEFYGSTTDEQRTRGRRYVDRALELAPQLGEAHASLAGTLIAAHDAAGAEREYRRAIELTPSYADVYRGYAGLLHDSGRYEQSLEMARRAVALDPLSPGAAVDLRRGARRERRSDEAHAALDKVIADFPDFRSPTGAVPRPRRAKATSSERCARCVSTFRAIPRVWA
jgi:TolB-like protein